MRFVPRIHLWLLVAVVMQPARFAVAQSNGADESAIRAVVKAFNDARNAGEAKTMASLFSADGELINQTGHVVKGTAELEKFFAAGPRVGMTNTRATRDVVNIRFITPEIAVVTVTGEVKTSAGAVLGRLVDVDVMRKEHGAWRIVTDDNIRVADDANPAAHRKQ